MLDYIYIMVKFIQFDETEEVSNDLENDLRIINEDLPPPAEDLKESPFINKPARVLKKTFKPPPLEEVQEEDIGEPPALSVKSIKPKKPLSKKQLANLERMRLKKVKKAQEQLEKTISKNDITKSIEQPKEYTEEEMLDMEQSEFDDWLKYMSRFDKMIKAKQQEEQRAADEIYKKEKEIEDRIRKKIELENNQRNNNISNKITESVVPILQQQAQPDYGEYASYFGF